MASHDRPPLAPVDDNLEVGQARRLRSLFTPWKGGGGEGGANVAAGGRPEAPPPTPVVLRSWPSQPHPPPPSEQITLTLAQQHALPGGRGRALAFDLSSGGSPALYAGDGPASLRKLSLLSPNAPLALRLPTHSRGARAVAPPAHVGCRHLAGVATAGAGLVVVSGETGNTVAAVPFLAGGRGIGATTSSTTAGGPSPGASAGAWSVAWSPLRPTHELLVGLDGGRVATIDLRCAASPSSSASAAGRAVLSVVRVGGGAGAAAASFSSSSSSLSSSTLVGGPPVHTLVPLPPGCEAALVGGEFLAASAAGVFALWRPPGLGPLPLAAPGVTPQLPRGASCESVSVSPDGRAVAVSVRRRAEQGGAEVWVFGLAGEEEEQEGEEQEEEDEGRPVAAAAAAAATAVTPLRLGGHASAAHMTAGALLPMGGRQGLVYATGDEARRAPVAWRLPARSQPSSSPSSSAAAAAGSAAPLLFPSLAPPNLPAPLPSPVLAVAGARVPGLGGGGGGEPPLLLAAASAGCVRVYQAS